MSDIIGDLRAAQKTTGDSNLRCCLAARQMKSR
jgi:hypothetical protein